MTLGALDSDSLVFNYSSMIATNLKRLGVHINFAPVVDVNSNPNNPIIYTGFEPAWILIKRTDAAANWRILDNKRSPTNPINKELYPNLNNAEGTWTALNFYSNGFQLQLTMINDN